MAISPKLIENLPVYARLADETGLLQHFADAIQPDIDETIRLIDSQFYLFDASVAPARFLDYLGQYVGLAPIGTTWQGLGMNPKWTDAYKRTVILRAWSYFQRKGTLQGIRDAIDIWLQFPGAQTDKLIIRLPFGKHPTDHPPNWWTYDTPYGAHLNQTYIERQHFGSGDHPGTIYRPDWFTIQADDYYWLYDGIQWNQHTVMEVLAPLISDHSSHLGPERPWEHLSLNAANWNLIFPDIYRLNPEIWNAHADVTTFGWLNLPLLRALRIEKTQIVPTVETILDLAVDGMQYGDGIYGGDWFPYASQPAGVHSITRTVTREFGNYPGWQYSTSYFGSAGGEPIPTDESQAMVFRDGNYPGTQWGDLYSSRQQLYATVPHVMPPNTGVDVQWGEVFDRGLQWQFQGETTTTLEPAAVYVADGSAYYSPPTLIVDPTLPTVTPPIYTEQWWANFRVYTETVTTDEPSPGVPCAPGVAAQILDGYDERLVGGTPGEPASQLLTFVPGSTTVEIVKPAYAGFVGFPWFDQWLSLGVPPYDLTITYHSTETETLTIETLGFRFEWQTLELPPTPEIHSEPLEIATFVFTEDDLTIDLSTGLQTFTIDTLATPVETLTIDALVSADGALTADSLPPPADLLGFAIDWGAGNRIGSLYIDFGAANQNRVHRVDEKPLTVDDFWQSHPSAEVTVTHTTEPTWALAEPFAVALYNWDYFDDGTQWYNFGRAPVPPTLERVPRYRIVQLCNVFKNWSTRTITLWHEYEIDLPLADLPLFELYPIIGKVSQAHNWRLLLEANEEVYVLAPVTMFWSNLLGAGDPAQRSQSIDLERGRTNLYLEFIVQPKLATKLRSASLVLESTLLRSVSFADVLDFSDSGCFGFRFTVPLRFPSGAGSTDENLAIQEFFPSLVEHIVKLDADYAGIPIVRQTQPPVLTPVPTNPGDVTEESLRDLLNRVIQHVDALDQDVLALEGLGDKNYVHYQVEPSARWVIQHRLNKQPSVTVILDDDQAVLADLDYSMVNTVFVLFDRPVTGRATCN